jgi:hypothetical protein
VRTERRARGPARDHAKDLVPDLMERHVLAVGPRSVDGWSLVEIARCIFQVPSD